MEQKIDPIEVTHKNIRAIYEHEQRQHKKQPLTHRIAHSVANWAGTVSFIIWHLIIFGLWIAINLAIKFDPWPFVALTTFVSLESILLSGFILISQNTIASDADRRHQLDLQINLLSERESTAALKLLDRIAEKLNIPLDERLEVRGLADETNPSDVLEQIVQVEKIKESK